jgi:hypothetical protein
MRNYVPMSCPNGSSQSRKEVAQRSEATGRLLRVGPLTGFVCFYLILWLGCGRPATPVVVTTGSTGTVADDRVDGRRLPIESAEHGAARPDGGGVTADDRGSRAEVDPPKGVAGKWILCLVLEAEVSQPWMLEVTGDEGSYSAKIVDSQAALARLKPDVRGFRKSEDRVQFELVRENEVWPFEGVVAGNQVRGAIELRDRVTLAWLERTRLASMRSVPASSPAAGWSSFEAAQRSEDSKELAHQLLQFADEQSDSPLVFDAFRVALRMSRRAELSESEVRQAVEKYRALSQSWGKRWSEHTLETIASDLATADGPENPPVDALVLEFAEAARKALPEDAAAPRKRAVDLAYALALVRNNRAQEGKELIDELIARAPEEGELQFYAAQAAEKLGDEAGAIDLLVPLWPHPLATRELERIWRHKNGSLEGLDARLDELYLSRFPPLPVEAFAGREGGAANPVALGELFTGSSCPPCVAADVAFEALGRTFKPSELVLLQYHLHVPGPDPMTNEVAESRAEYYNLEGTPAMLLNGRESAQGGGSRQHAPAKYSEYRTDIEKLLGGTSGAMLKLTANRDKDTVNIEVNVRDLPEVTEKLRLRLALVEEQVRFSGRNGIRLHHAVVRAMPGGPAGFAVSTGDEPQRATVDIAEVRESLSRELEEFEKKISEENRVNFEFPSKPLELKRLRVVAFLQNDETHSVLQAASVSLDGSGE